MILQYVLNPTFVADQISQVDSTSRLSRAYDGSTYLPGTLSLTLTHYSRPVARGTKGLSPPPEHGTVPSAFKLLEVLLISN